MINKIKGYFKKWHGAPSALFYSYQKPNKINTFKNLTLLLFYKTNYIIFIVYTDYIKFISFTENGIIKKMIKGIIK